MAASAGTSGQLADRIRRQRRALGMPLAEIAARSRVSTGFLSMLENGQGHEPGSLRLARVLDALGLESAPYTSAATQASAATPTLPARLGAILGASHGAAISDLLIATGAQVSELRAALEVLRTGLRGSGMTVVESVGAVKLSPAPGLSASAALFLRTSRSPMTEARMTVVAIVAAYGVATRHLVEEIRGVDSVELLAGLVEDAYLEVDLDEMSVGRPRVYRLTTKVLEEIGVETIERLRRTIQGRAGLNRASSLEAGTGFESHNSGPVGSCG